MCDSNRSHCAARAVNQSATDLPTRPGRVLATTTVRVMGASEGAAGVSGAFAMSGSLSSVP